MQGYDQPELWDPADFAHFKSQKHIMPSTWSLVGEELHIHMPEASYELSEVAHCPVYVSLAEALAYCKLHGARLMSEEEWVHIAGQQQLGNVAALRVQQLGSGGWEWTSTPFAPFPGTWLRLYDCHCYKF